MLRTVLGRGSAARALATRGAANGGRTAVGAFGSSRGGAGGKGWGAQSWRALAGTTGANGQGGSEDDDDDGRQNRLYRRADSEMVVMDTPDGEENDHDDLLEMLQREQLEAAQVKIPWFLEEMPTSYFKQVPAELRDQHLSALVALYDFDAVPELTLNSADGTSMTMISGGTVTPAKLNEQLARLPKTAPLSGMQVFNSKDGEMSLNVFTFQNSEAQTQGGYMSAELEEYVARLQAGEFAADPLHAQPAPYFEKDALSAFLAEHCGPAYVTRSSPRRFCKQVELYHHVINRGEDEVGIDIEPNWAGTPDRTMITLAVTNVLVVSAIQRLTAYFSSKNLRIIRTHLDLIRGPKSDSETDERDAKGHFDMLRSNRVALFRILVAPHDAAALAAVPGGMDALNTGFVEDLPTVSKWMDDRALDLVRNYGMSSRESELVIALCDVAHAILAPRDAYEFARTNVEAVVADPSRLEYTQAIVKLFMNRFNPAEAHPERDDAVFATQVEALRSRIRDSGELKIAQEVLSTLLDVVQGVKRTNLFAPNRFGVCFRLDPAVCVQNILDEAQGRTEVPYGVFFVHGRRFAGFHLRFRDIARGGLRIVTPRNREMHAVESARQLVECYDLAFAQQLKNKDIAEGGSKAVCLVDTHGFQGHEREHIMRKSLKAMVNSILDVITPNERNADLMVDHMGGAAEFIYFGPDEQVTPEHINWIVKRADQRGYPMPNAFMSSKPDAGFNHKEFGVTSEGVAVFLGEALRSTGVRTDQPFTIKITGGPDGDVAGNMLKILNRDYGENARIVGLADGTASVVDPEGIPWAELMRLFHSSSPLEKLDPKCLSPSGALTLCDTPAGINKRNMMHNQVVADAFVPAGGRPATINDSNWEKFLMADGKPSSPLIVEGANLFLTPLARERLSAHGCVIVKDSSANKCGVICSSMEIISSMLLSKAEFLELKPKLVADVLDGLRQRAESEAKLMFREYKSNPSAPLPPVSTRISLAINRSTDAFAAVLEGLEDEQYQRLLPVIRSHLPKALMDKAWDRFQDRVPPAYIRFQLACILASQLVYREGVSYAMSINEEVLGHWLLDYLERAIETNELASRLEAGGAALQGLSAAEAKLVVDVLRHGGARTMVDHHLGSKSE